MVGNEDALQAGRIVIDEKDNHNYYLLREDKEKIYEHKLNLLYADLKELLVEFL